MADDDHARSPCLMPRSDISARIPPSPSLSARMTTATYLSEVVISSVQTISDSMPMRDGRRGAARPFQRGLQRVERARADIAVDDAKRAEHQGAQTANRRVGLSVGDSGFDRHQRELMAFRKERLTAATLEQRGSARTSDLAKATFMTLRTDDLGAAAARLGA